MSKWVEQDKVNDELTNFCIKIKRSSYGDTVRREVLLSWIKGYERMKRNHAEGKWKMYREQEEGKEIRWTRKTSRKQSW